jgi:hypothetical protein
MYYSGGDLQGCTAKARALGTHFRQGNRVLRLLYRRYKDSEEVDDGWRICGKNRFCRADKWKDQ